MGDPCVTYLYLPTQGNLLVLSCKTFSHVQTALRSGRRKIRPGGGIGPWKISSKYPLISISSSNISANTLTMLRCQEPSACRYSDNRIVSTASWLKTAMLVAYDQHLELAKSAYRSMLHKVSHQQIVDDILFCGSSGLSWEESSCSLSNLYRLDLHSKENYAFYYLHEINNQFHIDSPLPKRETVTL